MPVDNPADGKDVNCGPIGSDSNGVRQNLMAKATPNGTVGCTEAFNVLDEYKKHPVDQAETGTMGAARLPSGWACASVPHAELKGIRIVSCDSGKEDGHGGYVGGRSFYSEPVR
ncbi:hypothetical protein [Amycolatopsis sp. NPDC059021]|uniref:hypothetical protein n=1 Tax=Amycolatopsis sp. NPDC059021 TaxID=3346704 RepID=UPI00366C1D1B